MMNRIVEMVLPESRFVSSMIRPDLCRALNGIGSRACG